VVLEREGAGRAVTDVADESIVREREGWGRAVEEVRVVDGGRDVDVEWVALDLEEER
jgi:hypothetical protein